ncbi:MAG TPA: response regulator, partial [Microthrixaceae bacterium]|nr:response regulator [Microthrixaceae bacterium]
MELGPRVLVVDDDAGVRRMLARVLQQAGFACAQAESADAARGALAEQPVTALLCDVHLVGEDGLSLARWVRTHHRETAVLLITGSTSVEGDDIARHAGDGVLLKPFAAPEILIH